MLVNLGLRRHLPFTETGARAAEPDARTSRLPTPCQAHRAVATVRNPGDSPIVQAAPALQSTLRLNWIGLNRRANRWPPRARIQHPFPTDASTARTQLQEFSSSTRWGTAREGSLTAILMAGRAPAGGVGGLCCGAAALGGGPAGNHPACGSDRGRAGWVRRQRRQPSRTARARMASGTSHGSNAPTAVEATTSVARSARHPPRSRRSQAALHPQTAGVARG